MIVFVTAEVQSIWYINFVSLSILVCIMSSFSDVCAGDASRKTEESNTKFINRLDQGFELLEVVYDKQANIQDFVFLEVNSAYEKQTGIKAAEIIGKRKKEAAPAPEQRWYDYAIQAVKTGETLSYQYYNSKVGAYYETEFMPLPPNQIAVLFKDITRRKQAEDALTQTKKNLENVIQQSPIAFALFDKDGFLIQVNDAWDNLWQIPRELVIGTYNVLQSNQVADAGLLSNLGRVYAGETIRSFELEFDALIRTGN